MQVGIGIDIGGTKIAGALVDKTGVIRYAARVETPPAGSSEVVSAVIEMVQSLHQQAAQAGYGPVRGVGIGTAGQVDFAGGRVISGTSLIRDWFDVPLRQLVADAVGLPVFVDNDVNVLAVAEGYLGAAKGHQDVVCLALGTGVGGGVLIGGRILHGHWGAAAELGHVSVNMYGPACNCGSRGCLEVYASGPGLVQRLLEEWQREPPTTTNAVYAAWQADATCLTSQAIFRWSEAGDVYARRVLDQMVDAIALAIIGFIHTFNPTVIVLGGGVLNQGEWLCNEIARRIRGHGMSRLVDGVEVKPAQFGQQAAVVGAAYQCWLYTDEGLLP